MKIKKQLEDRVLEMEKSKIIRLEDKDIMDIEELLKVANKDLLNQIINEVLSREDLYESKRKEFLRKLSEFRVRYNV